MQENNRNNDDADILVTLELDDGTETECEILTIFTVNEQDYIALLPLDDQDATKEENPVFIYRYHEDKDGNPYIDNIGSDEEYETVSSRFEELLEEIDSEDIVE